MNKKFFEVSAIVKEADEKKEKKPSLVGGVAKGAGAGLLAAGGAHLAGSAIGGARLPSLGGNLARKGARRVQDLISKPTVTTKIKRGLEDVGTHLKKVPYGKAAKVGAVVGGLVAAKKIYDHNKKKKEANA